MNWHQGDFFDVPKFNEFFGTIKPLVQDSSTLDPLSNGFPIHQLFMERSLPRPPCQGNVDKSTAVPLLHQSH